MQRPQIRTLTEVCSNNISRNNINMEFFKRSRNRSSSPQSFEPTQSQSSTKQDTGSTPPPAWFDVHHKDSLNLDHEQGLGNLAKMTLDTIQSPSSQDPNPSEFVEIMSDMKHKLCSLLSSFEANLIEKFDQRLRVVEDNNTKLKTKLELVYLPKGKYCVYPRMVYRQAMA